MCSSLHRHSEAKESVVSSDPAATPVTTWIQPPRLRATRLRIISPRPWNEPSESPAGEPPSTRTGLLRPDRQSVALGNPCECPSVASSRKMSPG
jgi:hypothetical protein